MRPNLAFGSVLFALILLISSCNIADQKSVIDHKEAKIKLFDVNRQLLEVAMEDGFSPPIASRVYVYPHLSFYLALQKFYPDSLNDISKGLNDFKALSDLGNVKTMIPEAVAQLLFIKVARSLVFSEHYMETSEVEFLEYLKNENFSGKLIMSSLDQATKYHSEMMAWVSADNYKETRTMQRYTSRQLENNWIETPPDYQSGLEPHWEKIRPIALDTMMAVENLLPPFSIRKGSDFYNIAMDVYNTSNKLDTNMVSTAWFWDDNPNTSDHAGHSVAMFHKISPPGHWLNITSIVTRGDEVSLFKTVTAFSHASIAMFDGVIQAWQVKYKYDVIRPVTYIQRYIDREWNPLIQTPPFPEYISGHSVISASAAEVLTELFGDKYKYKDDNGIYFGYPNRDYNSFLEAAWEVSLSRYYGGIHYIKSVEDGYELGKLIGASTLSKLQPTK